MRAHSQSAASNNQIELWAGFECSLVRIGNAYVDQLELTGHASRLSDLDLLSELGARAVRYPVLWERTAPKIPTTACWKWSDERLARLRALGIRPILGLTHHGSGPRYTHLLDPGFPALLCDYARMVAERYPWVEWYTPLNEPLTTARFSGLYGHWYPHGRDDLSFVRILLNECRAVVLAMQSIRELTPTARLVQTEDLGKTFSTPVLSYQAEFENERRWLTFDLLCGRLGADHPLWPYLRRFGMSERERDWFQQNRCPPDIIGINHYLSSERFLDDSTARYPEDTRGGNGTHAYADVLAARVLEDGPAGPAALLRETWARYGLPLAITEAHNACTREEQMRWLSEVWTSAEQVRRSGVDVRAVTAWSILGAYDWDSLLTRKAGHYEAGLIDLRGGKPRRTAAFALIRDLAAAHDHPHPALDESGWWRRPHRLIYGPPVPCQPDAPSARLPKSEPPYRRSIRAKRELLITGATGTLGRAFARICEHRGLSYRLTSRQEMDIGDPASVRAALQKIRPWAVVNTAGFVRVDEAEAQSACCHRENADGATHLSAACGELGLPFLTYSSDLVFDGKLQRPYIESDPVGPLNVYGHSKAAAEAAVRANHSGALVIRASAFFGPWDEYNFVTIALRTLMRGEPFVAVSDNVVSPTYIPDLVDVSLDLLIDGERGLWHLANPGALSWADLARRAAEAARLDHRTVMECSAAEIGWRAVRPRYSALTSERAVLLPPLDDALERFVQACSCQTPT